MCKVQVRRYHCNHYIHLTSEPCKKYQSSKSLPACECDDVKPVNRVKLAKDPEIPTKHFAGSHCEAFSFETWAPEAQARFKRKELDGYCGYCTAELAKRKAAKGACVVL